jgi:hypothetical protein
MNGCDIGTNGTVLIGSISRIRKFAFSSDGEPEAGRPRLRLEQRADSKVCSQVFYPLIQETLVLKEAPFRLLNRLFTEHLPGHMSIREMLEFLQYKASQMH